MRRGLTELEQLVHDFMATAGRPVPWHELMKGLPDGKPRTKSAISGLTRSVNRKMGKRVINGGPRGRGHGLHYVPPEQAEPLPTGLRPRAHKGAEPTRLHHAVSPVVKDLHRMVDRSPMSRESLVETAGISTWTMQRWFIGSVDPRLSLLEAIGEVLGYELVWQKKRPPE